MVVHALHKCPARGAFRKLIYVRISDKPLRVIRLYPDFGLDRRSVLPFPPPLSPSLGGALRLGAWLAPGTGPFSCQAQTFSAGLRFQSVSFRVRGRAQKLIEMM